MKPKTMVLMVIAIVCGLGASYMTSRLLAERGNDKEEIPKVKVVVAKKTLNVGAAIKKPADLFELKEFAKGQEPKDAFTSLDRLKNKYLKRNLRPGDFVTPKEIDDTQTVLELPEGMVAVGIRVTAESTASGFAATPGSRINIIWTIRGNTALPSQSATLLENVLVLAADTRHQADEGKGPMPAQVVTVALSQQDAQEVKLAQQAGDLSFTLRRGDDDGKSKASIITMDILMKKLRKVDTKNEVTIPEPEAPKVVKVEPQPAPPPPPQIVKVIPKFERHVIQVREGKSTFSRIFWFDEQGQPVPETLVKKYEEEAAAATQSPPQAPVVGPTASAPQPESAAPPAVEPQPALPEVPGEQALPQQKPDA